MAFSCFSRQEPFTKKFTVLYVHILSVSHPSVLAGTSQYAKELVERFFKEHTSFDPSVIEPHSTKFVGLQKD